MKQSNTTGNYKLEESIVVKKSIKDAFSFVTDLQNAGKISSHLKNIEIIENSNAGIDNKYARQLIIHRFKNNQTIIVTDYEQDKLYKTSTKLFGVNIDHTYFFEAIDNHSVQVKLIKEASFRSTADRLLRPFVIHQLTRPEHDGQHLATLKKAVEAA